MEGNKKCHDTFKTIHVSKDKELWSETMSWILVPWRFIVFVDFQTHSIAWVIWSTERLRRDNTKAYLPSPETQIDAIQFLKPGYLCQLKVQLCFSGITTPDYVLDSYLCLLPPASATSFNPGQLTVRAVDRHIPHDPHTSPGTSDGFCLTHEILSKQNLSLKATLSLKSLLSKSLLH
jgi:hypothetical protein